MPAASTRTGAEAVDQKTRRRLPDAGNDEENRHRRPDAGEGQPELLHQPRKQRRQQQVEKVRDAMHEADQRDGFDIVGGTGRGQGFGGHRAAAGVSGT
jgi:hypothetical protein